MQHYDGVALNAKFSEMMDMALPILKEEMEEWQKMVGQGPEEGVETDDDAEGREGPHGSEEVANGEDEMEDKLENVVDDMVKDPMNSLIWAG